MSELGTDKHSVLHAPLVIEMTGTMFQDDDDDYMFTQQDTKAWSDRITTPLSTRAHHYQDYFFTPYSNRGEAFEQMFLKALPCIVLTVAILTIPTIPLFSGAVIIGIGIPVFIDLLNALVATLHALVYAGIGLGKKITMYGSRNEDDSLLAELKNEADSAFTTSKEYLVSACVYAALATAYTVLTPLSFYVEMISFITRSLTTESPTNNLTISPK